MPEPEPGERFPRSRFLEGATLGLGGVIGAIVTLPAAGFAVLPGFLKQKTAYEIRLCDWSSDVCSSDLGANVDPKRDVLISEGPLDHLDHAPTLQFYGGKLGIDATHKGPAEGARPWPEEISMSDEVRRLVDKRWDEYGIEATAEADGRSKSALRQLLRR